MLKRVVAIAAAVLLLMVAVKDGRVFRSTGLTGTCSVVQTVADGAELAVCNPGRLEGRPDLSHRGCKLSYAQGKAEVWRCPAGFDVSDAAR